MDKLLAYYEGTILPADIKRSQMRNAAAILRGESKALAPFGKVQLMLYIDKFGDFLAKKGPIARICQSIFDSLSDDDKHAVMNYLMDQEDENEY